MFIETRFFDNGKAIARLHRCEVEEIEPNIEILDDCDSYIEEISDLHE